MPTLGNRISTAWKALKGANGGSLPVPYPSSMGGGYGGWGLDGQGFSYGWDNALSRYRGTNLDYKREAGDLSASSLVMAPVNWMGTTLPEARPQIVIRDDNDKKTVVKNHPLIDLLNRPNPYYSGALLWKAFAFSWFVGGNVYWYKVRDARGEVVQLWYFPHYLVAPAYPMDGSDFIAYYQYKPGTGAIYHIAKEDIVHFRYGLDPNNTRMGLGPIAALYREVYGDNEVGNHSAAIARNSGIVPFILTMEKGTTPDGIDGGVIKQKLRNLMTGDKRGEPGFFNGPLKAQKVGLTPQEMDLTQLRRLPEERICAVLGISPMLLHFGAGLDHSTYSNYEVALQQGYQSVIKPTHRLISDEISVQLLAEVGGKPGQELSWDYSEVSALQDDKVNVAKSASVLFLGGVITRGEARTMTNHEATPDDDVFYVPRGGTLVAPDEVVVGGTVAEPESAEDQGDTIDGKPPQGQLPPAPTRKALTAGKFSDEVEITQRTLKAASSYFDDAVPKKYKGLLKAGKKAA